MASNSNPNTANTSQITKNNIPNNFPKNYRNNNEYSSRPVSNHVRDLNKTQGRGKDDRNRGQRTFGKISSKDTKDAPPPPRSNYLQAKSFFNLEAEDIIRDYDTLREDEDIGSDEDAN